MLYAPPYPGEIIKEDIVNYLNISVTEFADILGMSRVALSRVLNGKAAISINLVQRLEAAGFSTADTWLQMQLNYDLWHANQNKTPLNINYQKLEQYKVAVNA